MCIKISNRVLTSTSHANSNKINYPGTLGVRKGVTKEIIGDQNLGLQISGAWALVLKAITMIR